MDKRCGPILLVFLHVLVLKIGVVVQRLLRVPCSVPEADGQLTRKEAAKLPEPWRRQPTRPTHPLMRQELLAHLQIVRGKCRLLVALPNHLEAIPVFVPV